ncbi:formate dehydrogenase subunit delta [Sphingobium amiense]|uniref:formate dehydrogenase subunit delta n=1 Tax=Sphingobium amiense TaxID=135719 RepID=UPI000835392F|nr:formate dehydrogenase subunit delta [Sphingobium amiense]
MSDNPEVMSTADRLVYMAHQIARNMGGAGEEQTARAVADHLIRFWDPRMKDHIVAIARAQQVELSPTVARAIAYLAERQSPDDSGQSAAD